MEVILYFHLLMHWVVVEEVLVIMLVLVVLEWLVVQVVVQVVDRVHLFLEVWHFQDMVILAVEQVMALLLMVLEVVVVQAQSVVMELHPNQAMVELV
jgi:hypothetical protein